MAWQSMANVPTFMRRASRPKNSSSRVRATAIHSRAKASAGTRAALARRIARNMVALMLGSMVVGSYVLEFFGISLAIVRVGGGLIVASMAWRLLNTSHASDDSRTELAEAFSNSVYEQSEALKPVADKFKLSLQQASGVSREPGKPLPPALQHPKVLQALFAPDALRKQRNTEAIETAPSTLVSARVLKHHPSVLRPLAEVRDELRTQWVRQRAAELARAEGQAQLQAWQAKPEGAALGAALVVSRDQPQAQPRALVDAALRADPAQLPALVGVDLGSEGYAVLRVNKIVPREAQSEAQAAATRQQFAQLWAQAEVQAYLEALKKQFKVELLAVRAKSEGGAEKP